MAWRDLPESRSEGLIRPGKKTGTRRQGLELAGKCPKQIAGAVTTRVTRKRIRIFPMLNCPIPRLLKQYHLPGRTEKNDRKTRTRRKELELAGRNRKTSAGVMLVAREKQDQFRSKRPKLQTQPHTKRTRNWRGRWLMKIYRRCCGCARLSPEKKQAAGVILAVAARH